VSRPAERLNDSVPSAVRAPDLPRGFSARNRVGAAVAAAVAVTVVIVAVPHLRFAYENATLKIACETAASLGAALAAFLVVGRSRLRPRLDDELLAYGLGLLAVADLLLVLLPSRVATPTTLRLVTWAPLGCQLVATVLLASAARPNRPGRRIRRSSLALVTLVAVAAVVALALLLSVPADTARSIPIASAAKPQLQREPLVAAVQLGIAALLLTACVGFTMRADRDDDRFASWVALGCGLTAVARLNLALFPSLFSRWLYTGDVIRLAGYGCWLLGSAFEIASYWRALASSAVTEERRRVARELHDGLAQELAFLTSELRSWPPTPQQFVAASAAERALEESRRAIAALSDSDVPLDEALRRTVEDIALRHHARGSAVTEVEQPLATGAVEQVLRIAREASLNACRHGRAREVRVSLRELDRGYRLVIDDDGDGFDTRASRPDGFGLGFMRERAELLGGNLQIESTPGCGARVTVEWR
jgi:signal transduction histidine kinase